MDSKGTESACIVEVYTMTGRRPVGLGVWALCTLSVCSCRDSNEPALELSVADGPAEVTPAAFPSLGVTMNVAQKPVAAAPRPETGTPTTLRVRISRVVEFLMADGTRTEVEAQAHVRFLLESDSDRGAALHLALGHADAALLIGPLTGRDQERGLNAAPLGQYAMAVVVHPRNPVRSVSATMLQQLLTGTLKDWSQLGAPACPVQVFALLAGDPVDTRNLSLAMPADSLPPEVRRVANPIALCREVQNTAGGLGLVPLGVALNSGTTTQLLAIDGATPSEHSATNGTWTYSVPVLLATKAARAQDAQRIAEAFRRSAAWHRALGL